MILLPWWWTVLVMLGALGLDRRFGEPPARLHPVVGMGRVLAWLGGPLPGLRAPWAFAGGALAWCAGALCCIALGAWVQQWFHAAPVWLALPLLVLALKPLLAWRMLRDEVAAVESALAVSLHAGRERLARLVSRDVAQLDADAVRESAIETLAENLNDSVVAPLFWFAVAGLPGAALYRWANTADAMWGYPGRWEWAGKWAARADDVLSWLPARLTALALCAASARPLPWRRLMKEARTTPSPNGGWPMAAMALLLRARLRKPGVYALNAGAPSPDPAQLRLALTLAGRAVVASVAALALLAVLVSWPALAKGAQ